MEIDYGLILFYNSAYVAVAAGLVTAVLIVLRRKVRAQLLKTPSPEKAGQKPQRRSPT